MTVETLSTCLVCPTVQTRTITPSMADPHTELTDLDDHGKPLQYFRFLKKKGNLFLQFLCGHPCFINNTN